MIDADLFWAYLKDRFTLFSGVPDSTFGPGYSALSEDPGVRFVSAPREDVALGVVSAASLCGGRGAVVMQNSGIGNVMNALTSFNLVYKIPALLVIGWRGYQGTDADAPEHSVMGLMSQQILDLMGIPNQVLDEEVWKDQLSVLVRSMDSASLPVALLVPPGVLRA